MAGDAPDNRAPPTMLPNREGLIVMWLPMMLTTQPMDIQRFRVVVVWSLFRFPKNEPDIDLCNISVVNQDDLTIQTKVGGYRCEPLLGRP